MDCGYRVRGAGLLLALVGAFGCGDEDSSPGDAGTEADAVQADLCSGCEDEALGADADADDAAIHLHHVHLNVRDRGRSAAFYRDHLGARAVRLNGATDALLAEPVLLLLSESAEAPSAALPTALQHIGFGAADPAAWYDEAHARGVEPDTRGHTVFNTNETPTQAGPGTALEATLGGEVPACFPILEQIAYMYVLGPDSERIEVWSGADGQVNHVHFTSADVEAAVAWFGSFLGLELDGSAFFFDGLLFFFEVDDDAAGFSPTDDHVLGHIAFSVNDLSAWRARADDQGIDVVSEPAEVHGFRSFFVRGPDGLLVELVEAAPLPGLCLDGTRP